MSKSVRPINPVPSFPNHMLSESKRLARDSRAYFFGSKSYRYLGWLTGKFSVLIHVIRRQFLNKSMGCGIALQKSASHFADNRSEILLNPWLTGKQSLSSRELWMLTLGLYR